MIPQIFQTFSTLAQLSSSEVSPRTIEDDRPIGNPQVPPFLPQLRHRIRPRPRKQMIEIATLLHDAEVRQRLRQRPTRAIAITHPIMRNGIHVGMAHEILQQDMDAVLLVRHVLRRRRRPAEVVLVVVIEVDFLAQLVQTVDLVEDVDLREIGVMAAVPGRRRAHADVGVFARVRDGGAGDSDDLKAFGREGVPSCVDFGRGVTTVDGGWVVDGAVDLAGVRGQVNGVEDGGWWD